MNRAAVCFINFKFRIRDYCCNDSSITLQMMERNFLPIWKSGSPAKAATLHNSSAAAKHTFKSKPKSKCCECTCAQNVQHGHDSSSGSSSGRFGREELIWQTKMVQQLLRNGKFAEARDAFEKVKGDADAALWNLMIGAYARTNMAGEAIAMYQRMLSSSSSRRRRTIFPDERTFPLVLKACAALGYEGLQQGREIHKFLHRIGLQFDSFVANALVNMYAKCGDVEAARQVFDAMPDRTVVSWNAMIAGYVQNEQYEDAFRLFDEMQLSGFSPNHVTLVNILPACCHNSAFLPGKEIHGYVARMGFCMYTIVTNALIDMYFKCSYVEAAVRVFSGMLNKDIVSWNSMVSGYVQNNCHARALQIFAQMHSDGLNVNAVTLSSVLCACGQMGSLSNGREVHGYVIKSGLVDNVYVSSALIDIYFKHNCVEDAEAAFQRNKYRDIALWNAMIVGYVLNGKWEKAFKIFRQMIKLGEQPNSITISGILPACAHLTALHYGKEIHNYALSRHIGSVTSVGNALVDMYAKGGAVESAYRVFESTHTKSIVSWNAMISAFGMHGHLDDALLLFAKMKEKGLKPDESTFISVLSACRHSGATEEGCCIFTRMTQEYNIVPKMEHYVSIVNILCRGGKLEEAYSIIRGMPFEADSTVWDALLAGCKNHCNTDKVEIYADNTLNIQLENIGMHSSPSRKYASAGGQQALET